MQIIKIQFSPTYWCEPFNEAVKWSVWSVVIGPKSLFGASLSRVLTLLMSGSEVWNGVWKTLIGWWLIFSRFLNSELTFIIHLFAVHCISTWISYSTFLGSSTNAVLALQSWTPVGCCLFPKPKIINIDNVESNTFNNSNWFPKSLKNVLIFAYLNLAGIIMC